MVDFGAENTTTTAPNIGADNGPRRLATSILSNSDAAINQNLAA
jgi:hypothetical protein